MNFVKTMLEGDQGKHSLKVLLHRQLARMEPPRSMATLHASEVTKSEFCARRSAIMLASGVRAGDEYLSGSMAMTFQIGRDVQDHIVSAAADAGIAVGHWRCVACNRLHEFCKRPVECHKCTRRTFTPVEVRFKSEVSGISGGFDMIMSTGLPKLRLVEIKTMAPIEFQALVLPLAEHKLRTALYLRIAAESANPLSQHIDQNEALVLYVSKGGFGHADPALTQLLPRERHSPFKEFVVKRDDAMTQPTVDAAMALTGWRTGVSGMPTPRCHKPTDKLAQWCPVAQYCFGSVFPPGQPNPHPEGAP